MARYLKHSAFTLLRLGLLTLLGGTVMLSGVMIMLRGIWSGVLLVLSGAILLAVPLAFCVTQCLCRKLYHSDSSAVDIGDTASSAPPHAATPIPKIPFCQVIRAWLTAEFYGLHIPFRELLVMRDRGTPPTLIVEAYIMIRRHGVPTAIATLEDLYITEHNRIHDAFDLVHIITGIKD